MMKAARAVLTLVLLLGLAGCSGSGGESASDTLADAPAAGAAEDVEGSGVALGGDDAAPARGEAPADADAAEPEVDQLPNGPIVSPGDRLIKEGTVSVEVAAGGFDKAFKAVVDAAQAHGGDAVASSTRTAENGDTFGSVTVRVPVANFEDLLVGLGDIGTVVTRNVGSQDVSAEFTDLESRLRHLQAQERFYLGLLERAEAVQDAITVQQQLDGIQGQIEKAQGRLNFLDDRTSLSTLTVELFEPGAGGPLIEDEPTDRPSLAHYWDVARDAFVNVVGAMLVVFLFLLPLLVPLSVVGALWFAHRRSRRRDAPRTAEPVDEREPVSTDA